MTERREFLRRGAWGLGDQAVSSLTNFVMSFAVLRAVSIEAFAAFTIAYTSYAFFLALARAAVSETLVVRFSDVPESEWRSATAAATGATLPLSVVCAASLVAAGLVVGGDVRVSLLAMAVVLPGLLLQDAWRFAFFAGAEPRKAFVNDAVWGVLQVAAVLVVHLRGVDEPAPYVLAWGASGMVAGLLGIAQSRVFPAVSQTRAWARRHRDLAGRFLAEAVIRRGTPHVTLLAIGAIAGLEALGLISAARVLMGPINILHLGFVAIGIPEAVRVWRTRPDRLVPATHWAGGVLGALPLVLGAALLALPAGIGNRLLDNWSEALTFMVPVAVAVAGAGFIRAMIIGLRALEAASRSLRAQAVMSALTAVGGIGGALVAGGWGAASGWAVSLVVASVVVQRDLVIEARNRLGRAATEAPAGRNPSGSGGDPQR